MAKINLLTPNPWLKVGKGKDKIADCDRYWLSDQGKTLLQYAQDINTKNSGIEIDFSCFPDPFCGNPNSKVYCLNKNPGKPDPCFLWSAAFKQGTIKNLQLNQATCFWAEKIINKCGKVHAGIDWMTKRTKQIESILGRHPNIFFIEYFPYHSTKGFVFPNCLPSYYFSNELIMKAMEEEKLIIIMREKKNWLERIHDLKSYPNLCVLKYPQGGYLTPNNIVRYKSKKVLTNAEFKKYF